MYISCKYIQLGSGSTGCTCKL